MREIGKTKIVLPERIQRGDVIRVQIVMQHPMDTGFFRDANANMIPAWFINDVRVRFGETEIARFEWTSGISRDPMVAFQYKAEQEGTLSVVSRDNRGSEFQGSAELKFTTT